MSRRFGLGARLGLGAAALVLATAGAVAWGVVNGVVGDLHRALELRGGAVARDLAEDAARLLEAGDTRGIEDLLERVWGEDDLAHVEIRNQIGSTIAARAFPAEPSEDAVITVPIATPPDEDGFRSTVGNVRVRLSKAGNRARQQRYLSQAARLTGAVALFGVLLAALMTWALVRPLRRLREAAVAMAAGEYDGAVPVRGAREVAELGQVVNTAMAAVAAREDELRTAYTQLRQAERVRESMTHMLVHDLKGPVSNVLMLLDVLEEGADEDDQPLFRQGRERCQDLLEMIGDLLAIGQLESDTPDLKLEAVHLGDLITEARGDVTHLARKRRAEITVEAHAAAVRLDRRLLRRVLVNLMLNALKHGKAPVQVTAQVVDGRVTLSVADAGPGVPAGEAEAVFEKFRQGAGTKGGAGLGLAFVRLVARAHGGDARVDGARFTVEFPARQEAA